MPTAQPTHPRTTSPFGPLTVIVDATVAGRLPAQVSEVALALSSTGLDHELQVADGPGDVERIAGATFARGGRFVAVAGDDGSLQDVVEAAFRDGRTVVDDPVIGVLPIGAGSELARSFGLPTDVRGAASHLRGSSTYALDVLKVTATDGDGRTVTRYGHNIAEVGFRAAVAGATDGSTRTGGRVRRFAAFWGTYLRWRPRDVTVHVDARTHQLRAWDVVIANGQFVDGGQRLSPRSYPGDGILDALVFVGPKADAYRMLPRIFMNGGHLPDPGVKELRSKIRVAVEPTRRWPVVLDGRTVGSTPVTVQIVPQQVLLKL
jgi:diacylglycerol kinase family enzyme